MEEKQLAVVEQLPIITERLEEVSNDIKQRTNEAMNLVVTEDNLATIKKIRASLNKEFSDYEDLRKQIKKKILESYEKFNIQYEELISNAFKTCDNALKEKINESECKIKDEKKNELKSYFNEYCESLHLKDIISYEQLNIKVTMSDSLKKLMSEIKERLERISNELRIIENEEYSNEIMLEYLKDFDYFRAKLEVIERQKQLQKIKEQNENLTKQNEKEEILIAKVDEEIIVPQELQEDLLTTRFEVKGTKEQLISLRDFMKELNVEFKSI